MKEKEFRVHYAGLFASSGLWIDGKGKYIEIEDMDESYKSSVINHLLKGIHNVEKCKKSSMKGYIFSGKHAKTMADKLTELGCGVIELENEEYRIPNK